MSDPSVGALAEQEGLRWQADTGARVRAARERAGLTQEELAAQVGVTQTAVSYWEAGKRGLDLFDLLRVAGAVGVPAAALLPSPSPATAAVDEPKVPQGYFAEIAFFGRIEHTGYVTEVVLHGGQAAYHIDLPEKLWGGNPLAWREYAASALFEKHPVTEASVRAQWEAERERAERWRLQQAERDRAPAALPPGEDDSRSAWEPF